MNSPNKIIWIFNQFAGHPESGWGERHYYFAKYWIAEGYRVIIFSGAFNHMFQNLPQTNGLYTLEKVNQVEFCWVQVPRYHPQSVMRFWSMLVFAWRTFRFKTRSRAEEPAVIIVSSMPIFPILSALKKKKRVRHLKVIFEIRDIWPLSLVHLANISSRHPIVRFIGWFEKLGYRKSDHIVSLMPNAQTHAEKVAGYPVSFHSIPNGIDLSLLERTPLESSYWQQVPKDKFIVGYAGTMALANALEFLVEAARLLADYQDIHFVLVGEGYLKKELEAQASGLKNITFLPKVKKTQVQELLQFFNVCYIGWRNLPLYEHGVSANKYFDYMLAGKPVLDANNYFKTPVELSGGGIIVQPESSEAIAKAIIAFYEMPMEERQSMGQLGQSYVLQYHDIKYLAKKYLNIIES